MKRILSLFTLVLLLGLLVACGNKKTKSTKKEENEVILNIYDGTKEITVTYNSIPNRVVCNNVSSAEILIALGLADKIVGMYDPDDEVTSIYKDEIAKITKLGDKKTISNEIILGTNPDIIIGRTGKGDEVKAWNDLGVDVYFQKTSANINQSFENLFEDILNIGKIFNVSDKAIEYKKSLEAKVNSVKEGLGNTNGLKKAILMANFSGNSYGAYKSSFQEALLNLVGYTNASTSGSNFSLENLIELNPEFIIYVKASRNESNDLTAYEKLFSLEAISEVSAIKNNKVLVLTYVSLMDYGVEAINTLGVIYDFIKQ